MSRLLSVFWVAGTLSAIAGAAGFFCGFAYAYRLGMGG